MPRRRLDERIDHGAARELLQSEWEFVVAAVTADRDVTFIDEVELREWIVDSINHSQVGYRFCLPVQLLGKLTNAALDALSLQRGSSADADSRSWDARSLASKVIAPFNLSQESVLGSSNDPYVGNAMRIPRMERGDGSKRDPAGWNVLIDVLERVESCADVAFTRAVFRQVLLEFAHRQASLSFTYPVPPRISLERALALAGTFLSQKSGGDRALAIAGALFDVVGENFDLYKTVKRARINASDSASGQVADLECVDANDHVVLAVEVKDRALTLADVESTILKARKRDIREVLFAAAQPEPGNAESVSARMDTAFAAGQNLYRFDTLDLARVVLAIAGEKGRHIFLSRVGLHLDKWNTQPGHRTAWKKLLESV